MTDESFSWRIAGGSGDGCIPTGQHFAKALMRSGLHVVTHQHYTSRIRGGHIHIEVRAAPSPVGCPDDRFDFLVALGDSFARNPSEGAYYGNEAIEPLTGNLDDLRDGGVIVYDSGLIDIEQVPEFEDRVAANDWYVYPIDLRSIARDHGREVMRNTAGVGATLALLGADTTTVEGIITDAMDDEIAEANLTILNETYRHVRETVEPDHDIRLPTGEHDDSPVMVTGSHGVAYGALDAGCRFIAGYPMTPWSEVFHIMSNELPKVGGIAEQVEDEIAAASLAIGASHVGAKAMSGSSGGGFALMSEPLGLAEMTETPLVLVEAMRAGPSTGLPTKSEQGDLEHVLYTSQGDSNRVVFAPGNQREAYEQTRRAFDLAYEYQLPAIVVIDQQLASEFRSVEKSTFDQPPNPTIGSVLDEADIAELADSLDGRFKRYDSEGDDPVSGRPLPGHRGGSFLATGNEHNAYGHISEEPANRRRQMDRRMAKLEAIRDELDAADHSHQTMVGRKEAPTGIVTWGSLQGTVSEAVHRLNANGYQVSGLCVSDLMPFPEAELREFLDPKTDVLVVEMNYSGQFRGLIHRELGAFGDRTNSLLKYDGTPFSPTEIVDGYQTMIGEKDRPAFEQTRLEVATGD